MTTTLAAPYALPFWATRAVGQATMPAHVHVECFHHYLHGTNRAVGCPNCRGRARAIARFRFVARQAREQASDGDSSSVRQFTWSPSSGEQPQGYYHAATALPNGECAILVDPGVWTNIGGKDRVKKVAKAASEAGHMVRQRKLDTPLRRQGVGKGITTGELEVRPPPNSRASFGRPRRGRHGTL